MATDFANADNIVATLVRILDAESLDSVASIVRSADLRFEHTGYDNWNGGTDLYTLFLLVSPERFARIGAERESLEKVLTEKVKPVIDTLSDDWVSVQIRPRLIGKSPQNQTGQRISEVTRRDIIDFFTVSGTPWSGAMDETEFLERLYKMEKIPSTDSRFPTAAGDIHQHRINNFDWPDDWVFSDDRFELHHSDEKFLRFLAETLHPVVRRDPEQVAMLLRELNKRLQPDGWELAEAETISGRPCYAAQRVRSGAVMAVTRARVAADMLDAGWMSHEIKRMEKAIDTDPSLAIGTAKEFVETCCKTILTRRGQGPPKGVDIPMLVKLTAKELKLIPDSIQDAAKGADVIRNILRNLATITQGIAELRGLYGTGHGRDGKHRGLQPRHARLAVAAAIAFVDFVVETYRDREEQEPKPPLHIPSNPAIDPTK